MTSSGAVGMFVLLGGCANVCSVRRHPRRSTIKVSLKTIGFTLWDFWICFVPVLPAYFPCIIFQGLFQIWLDTGIIQADHSENCFTVNGAVRKKGGAIDKSSYKIGTFQMAIIKMSTFQPCTFQMSTFQMSTFQISTIQVAF